jgi:DNA-nicking Smr family endonuclease
VLIVHGRGLCSPAEPVLKGLVHRHLRRNPWRRWVLAFTSARMIDGGAGATCVLLRRRPRSRKRKGR